jgi:hypothetical protein
MPQVRHLVVLLGLATSSRRREAYLSWQRENALLHDKLAGYAANRVDVSLALLVHQYILGQSLL